MNKKDVLVVEDETSLAGALKTKLEHGGFTVTIARDGEGALAELKSRTFRVVILDLIMPRTDGFAVLEAMKKGDVKKSPVLVLSNLSQPQDRERAEQLGAIKFLIKADTPLADILAFVQKLD